MKSVPHEKLGTLIAALRKKRGWSQPELAARANVSQQTVSRWEQGASRPRPKELPALASLLEADLGELEEAAGYTSEASDEGGAVSGPTYDVALPLYTLRPDVFENFCVDLLARLYREQKAVVNRFGPPGSKQDGIDIEARSEVFGVYTFQCKQVKEFGPQMVHEAVAKHQFKADLNVLLLSNIASPKARKAIASFERWQLWDRLDISAAFRSLSMTDRLDLVDIYFPGQRRPLLGKLEGSALQSPDDFFKALVVPGRYFNHTWELVGREEELRSLVAHLCDDAILATLLLGAPGNGKSRLLREVVLQMQKRRPDIAIWFASATEDVKQEHLEGLGNGSKLVVVDDAHDRDDIAQILSYAAAPENKTRVLLSLRHYGRTMVRTHAALAAMNTHHIAEVDLPPRTKSDARVLAAKVLESCGEKTDAADDIAELTYTTPLVTVLAAQIVAKEKVPVAMLGNSQDFQSIVLGKLQEFIAGDFVAAADVPKLQAVLRMTALLQPVVFDDPGFLNILREVEDLEQEDVERMLRVLSESGVLFKRGLRHRLAPDLLADDIIQRNFISSKGAVTGKVVQVFEHADAQYLKHLLVNLGRLDWRVRQGETEGSVLLSSLAPKLQWHSKYHNTHVEAVEAVAYYQPALALDFAERLIEQGHGEVSGVCGMVRNAAYNFNCLERACLLLWRAGRTDARPLNQQPSHGIRVLKELAEFEPYKPVEYVDKVVDFALELLELPNTLEGPYTPFTILEGALRTDMEDMSSDGNTITINRYRLDFEFAKKVRGRVIDAILNSIANGPLRKAYLAADALGEALRSPMHSSEETHVWDEAHAQVLVRARDVLGSKGVHPAVLMKAAQSVSWHALYNEGSVCQPLAKSIFALLDRDLETRVVRLMVDAWGSDTWEDDDTFERKAHLADLAKTISDLSQEFPDSARLYDFLERILEEMRKAAGGGWGTPQSFIVNLLNQNVELAKEVMRRQATESSPLSSYAGAALAVLMQQGDRQALVSQVLDANSPEAWDLVSEAYARQSEKDWTEGDLAVIRRIFASSQEMVLIHAATIARNVAARNPTLATELIASADLTVSPAATRDFLMWMSHRETFPSDAISKPLWEKLLAKVAHLEQLDEHWGQSFLRKALRAHPQAVLAMLQQRMDAGKRHFAYRALRRDRNGKGLGLLEQPNGASHLRAFLKWAVDHKESSELTADIGSCVSGLCGKYGAEVHEVLLDMMAAGGKANVEVVASVLGSAHQEFVIDATTFVREVLNRAEQIGDQAVKSISSALWTATLTGGRSGIVGEPFKEDLRLREHCEEVLKTLHKLDPAHALYTSLLRYAQENIDRQAREKRTMQEEREGEVD